MVAANGATHSRAGSIAITSSEFELLRRLILEQFGIALTPEKKALLVGRLQSLLRERGIDSFRVYYEQLLSSPPHSGLSELVDRVSTNVTYFNRESAHFEFLVEVALPEVVERLRKQNRRDLRVWCAAASTGEEPYMLAMLISEFIGADRPGWQAGLLATDISANVLKVAKRGIYDSKAVQNVPQQLLQKYFQRRPDGSFQINQALRSEVLFRRFNLMTDPFPFKRPFDLIFCRNVMIYFTPETRAAVVSRIHEATAHEGYLFVGHSESLERATSPYEFVQTGVYRRKTAWAA